MTIEDVLVSKDAILVLNSGPSEWRERMTRWMNELREDHPFAGMDKEEIMRQLKKTREDVWESEYGH